MDSGILLFVKYVAGPALATGVTVAVKVYVTKWLTARQQK